jgi:hypothetical protein
MNRTSERSVATTALARNARKSPTSRIESLSGRVAEENARVVTPFK